MTRPTLLAFSANTQRPSRTRALVAALAARAAAHRSFQVDLRDLTSAAADLVSAGGAPLSGEGARLLAAIDAADALIVASPVYKGAYTGLFKHVFDLVPPAALAGKPVLVAATGGGYRHALVVEHHLRPLFGFFGAFTVPTAVYASEGDFVDGEPADPALLARIDAAARELAALVARPETVLRHVA